MFPKALRSLFAVSVIGTSSLKVAQFSALDELSAHVEKIASKNSMINVLVLNKIDECMTAEAVK